MLHRVLVVSLIAGGLVAADRVTLTGQVTDSEGKPLNDATVMVYTAGVKHGYSTFCPSCYADCGKRTATDQTGAYTVRDLDPGLTFTLLVIRDGYTPTFVRKVDPVKGPAATAALATQAPVEDPERVVRGRVVDAHGQPQRSAVVEPIGVASTGPHGPMSMYGTIDGLQPVAVTNANGEFELSHSQKATGMLLRVEARGMAPKIAAAPTGKDRTTIAVSEGGVIRGRLMNHGTPVGGSEVGIIPQNRGGYGANLKVIGDPYPEIRIGTLPDGTFVIPNVPAPIDWLAYGKMESIAALGATDPAPAAVKDDGQIVEIGDLEIRAGHHLRGKVTLSDSAAMADNMRITISATKAWDSQTVVLGRDGSFEFTGLPAGDYEIFTSVRGYSMPEDKRVIVASVEKDVDDFALTLHPAPRR